MKLGGIDTTAVLGYPTPWIVSPGEAIAFALSSPHLTQADVEVVRVRCGDPDPSGPGLRLEPMPAPIAATVALRHQPIAPGSCVLLPDRPCLQRLGSFALGAFIWPTLPGGRPQSVLSRWRGDLRAGWHLGLDARGCLEFVLGNGTGGICRVATERPVVAREWLFVHASYDAGSGRIQLVQSSLDRQHGRDCSASAEAIAIAGLRWPVSAAPLIAARSAGGDAQTPVREAHFDGKIDRPRIYGTAVAAEAMRALCTASAPAPADADLVAAWDFSIDIPGTRAHDRSANRLHGRLLHLPARGVTGVNWDGSSEDWRALPEHYGAIHFCSDDMADCGWSSDISFTIPEGWPGGYYSLRLSAAPADGDAVESHIGFFIRTPTAAARSRLAVLAPTATYLAYANSALRLDQMHAESMLEGLLVLSRDDLYLQQHRELGLSTYDTHADGSGWRTSSARRPILASRPRGNSFNYVNDTHLLDWLEQKGFAYDLITDEDLHHQGRAVLDPYGCVLTLSHPEYYSREMWDALDAWQRAGGRHMYLGGNGFYWRIAFHRELPHTIEVRRDVTGVRTWEGEAGEAHLAFSGEMGGLWRSNGRPPQRLVGVGFDAQVFDRSAGYRRLPASFDPRVAWMFAGIADDEIIGNFGPRNGGAAGLEVDRADATLGSSPDLLLVASADRLGYGGMPAPEEFRTYHRGLDGEQNSRVRADIVYFRAANGGGVFSVGSIAWVTALSHNGYANNVSRLTENTLRRFLDPTPLP